jgi:hypothetical protein
MFCQIETGDASFRIERMREFGTVLCEMLE